MVWKLGGSERKDEKPARKRTKFMANALEIAAELNIRCNGQHDHYVLIGRERTFAAAAYPVGLCDAMLIGLKKQIMMQNQHVRCSNESKSRR